MIPHPEQRRRYEIAGFHMKINTAIERALQNIAKFGDTDIFPFLFERHIFYDCPSECAALLREIHDNFDAHLSDRPPTTHESLTQVGYTGFRWATQIEPFWNAYYLALVIYLANQIEDKLSAPFRLETFPKSLVQNYRHRATA